MTTEYHNEFSSGDGLTAANVNTELGTLDAQIKINEDNIADILDSTDAIDPAILFAEQEAAPSTPATGYSKVFFKSDGMYVIDDEGTETGPFTSMPDYIKIIDSQTKGTDGGTSGAAGWNTRTLNTEVHDTGGIASLDTNKVTLAAGTYEIRASAPSHKGGAHELLWYNNSDSSAEVQGFSAFANTTDGYSRALLSGRFTIAGSKDFYLMHWMDTAQADTGLGMAVDIQDPDSNDLTETYAVIELWRVAH